MGRDHAVLVRIHVEVPDENRSGMTGSLLGFIYDPDKLGNKSCLIIIAPMQLAGKVHNTQSDLGLERQGKPPDREIEILRVSREKFSRKAGIDGDLEAFARYVKKVALRLV